MGPIILFISIICSSLLFILFKGFEKLKIHVGSAIVINYFVAAIFSFSVQGTTPKITDITNTPWGWPALFLGLVFIVFFNLMAFSSQKIGIAQTTVANKTTFIFPVIMGMTIFNEEVNLIKILGLLAAFIAVYFTSKTKTDRASLKTSNIALILLLFFGGGILDSVLAYSQTKLVPKTDYSLFTGYIFLIAGLFGLTQLIYELIKGNAKFTLKTIVGGLVLGIVNYGSIFFFLTAMGYDGIGSSIAFPISNMGIIVLASLLSSVIFKEILTKTKQLSILFAVISILLVGIFG